MAASVTIIRGRTRGRDSHQPGARAGRRHRVLGRHSSHSRQGLFLKMIPAESKEAGATPAPIGLGQKLLLLFLALFFCLIVFFGLDATYSHFSRRSSVPTPAEIFGCLGRDHLRVLALQPNCSCTRAWGRERYQLNVNSMGFRDETVREVPLTDPRPRILMLGDSFTESMGPWNTSFVGRIAARFPQYEILNGGVGGYEPS